MAVSTFTPKDRLIRYQPGRLRIPGAITPEDFLAITRILRVILQDIDDELRALRGSAYQDHERPKELHIRLNESDKPFPLPIFAGWVESEDDQQDGTGIIRIRDYTVSGMTSILRFMGKP
jgi:hypothetical protein